MFMALRWKRLGNWSRVLALAAGIGLTAGTAQAQPPAAPANNAPAPYVVHTTSFQLPFKMDRANLAKVREMHLWMRDGSGQWQLIDRALPTARSFTCRVPRDGEYGFSIATIDARGVPSPADVTRRPPEMMVVVETHGRAAAPQGHAIPPTPPAPLAMTKTPPGLIILNDSPPLVSSLKGPDRNPSAMESEEPLPLELSPGKAGTPRTGKVLPGRPAASAAAMAETLEPLDVQDDPGNSQDQPPPASSVLLANNHRVSIEFNVNKVGPSGLGKIVIYSTRDNGKTWERLAEESNPQSPVKVNLPGEGVYGIRVVGVNGLGFGGKAPAAGEPPASTIEIDTTKPKIHDWKVSWGKNGQLVVRWKVSDKNLGPEPINLFYSKQRNGPFKPLALKVKNDGCYRWSISHDLAPQYFLRLEACDLAGNIASCQTTNPLLVDRTAPDINVTGVSVIRGETPSINPSNFTTDGEE